ncbi:MAG: helix-turn-helix transcriptional regulator [Clostridia bacterium]|nr:helix-turn-helix transcriptional regulator [Clostridia bacterium]
MHAAPSPEPVFPDLRSAFRFFVRRIPPDSLLTPDPHGTAILYTDDADGILYTGDGRELTVRPGSLFFLRQEQSPVLTLTRGTAAEIVFDPALLRSPASSLSGPPAFPLRPDPALTEELLPLARALAACGEPESDADRCEILALLYRLLAACLRADALPSRENENGSPEDTQKGARLVGQILDAIHTRYAESLSVEKLAEEAGISPAYLHRLFRSRTGITPAVYIKTVRLRASCRLLEEGLSVSEVAENVGIPDTSYFIKLFRDAFGKTPHKWIRDRRASASPDPPARTGIAETSQIPLGGTVS